MEICINETYLIIYATKLYIACSYVQCFYNKAEYFHKFR